MLVCLGGKTFAIMHYEIVCCSNNLITEVCNPDVHFLLEVHEDTIFLVPTRKFFI